jgi:CsoR family transcriptional regulator, copper-sensing transcriptional repressor
MPGYADDKDQVLTRLRRIEGQVRGLQRLVDQDIYCIDVLTQISAVDKALKGVAVTLLDGTCATASGTAWRPATATPRRS